MVQIGRMLNQCKAIIINCNNGNDRIVNRTNNIPILSFLWHLSLIYSLACPRSDTKYVSLIVPFADNSTTRIPSSSHTTEDVFAFFGVGGGGCEQAASFIV